MLPLGKEQVTLPVCWKMQRLPEYGEFPAIWLHLPGLPVSQDVPRCPKHPDATTWGTNWKHKWQDMWQEPLHIIL